MMHLLYYLLKALKHHFLFEVKYKAKDQKCNINRKINLLTTIMGSVWTEKERNTYVVRTENIARRDARRTYQPRDLTIKNMENCILPTRS